MRFDFSLFSTLHLTTNHTHTHTQLLSSVRSHSFQLTLLVMAQSSNNNPNSAFQNHDNHTQQPDINSVHSPSPSQSYRMPTPADSSPHSNIDSALQNVRPSMQSVNSHESSGSNGQSYDELISQLNNPQKNVDLKTIGKHLVSPEESLKQPGGDITRRIYHQMENVSDESHPNGINIHNPKRRTRSTSFSKYLDETRRGSTASDINVPGGFRREFIIQNSIKKNQEPPNFLTQNFMEFLSMYGHYAGEDFTDDDDGDELEEDTDTLRDSGSNYEDVFDEESSLLGNQRLYGAVPQLPKQLPKRREQPKGTASVAKTFFLVFKALVGSGVLFLPRAFYNGGLLFSIITLSTFGLLTYFCYVVLIQSKETLKLVSYGELGFKTYGTPLKYSILVSILLSQVGFVATYVLFTSENMIAFIGGFLTEQPTWLTRANAVIVQCLLMIPLVWIRNLTKLSLVSLISSAFIVIGLLIIFWFSGWKIYLEGIGPNIANFNSNSWTMLIGVAVTSFEGIGLILPIEASMAQPEKFPMVLSVSMVVITAIFVSIGTIGYTAFGDKIKSIIILNLPQDNLAVQSILVLYSVAVFLSGPLQLFPAIKIGESIFFRHKGKTGSKNRDKDGKLYHHSGKYNPQVKWLKNIFRAASVTLVCFIAYLNADNIDKFVSFNGCFACIPLVYIYPPLIHLRSVTKKIEKSTMDRILPIFDYVLIVVGIITVIYSTYQIVFLN